MSSHEREQLFWIERQSLYYKALSLLLVLLIGLATFYFLPGKWANLTFAVTPILLFITLFGRLVKEQILSDSDSHAPLMTLGTIYIGMCWFIINNIH